jgi:hypothetical protein
VVPPPVRSRAIVAVTLSQKIFCFRFEANHLPIAAVSFHKRGGSRSSRNAGRDTVDAGSRLTSGADADGEVV